MGFVNRFFFFFFFRVLGPANMLESVQKARERRSYIPVPGNGGQ